MTYTCCLGSPESLDQAVVSEEPGLFRDADGKHERPTLATWYDESFRYISCFHTCIEQPSWLVNRAGTDGHSLGHQRGLRKKDDSPGYFRGAGAKSSY
jgi:hypothetical protein